MADFVRADFAEQGDLVTLNVSGFASTIFQVQGAFSGTLSFLSSADGANWQPLSVYDGSSYVTLTHAAGVWQADRGSANYMRVVASVLTSGDATVTLLGSLVTISGGGGEQGPPGEAATIAVGNVTSVGATGPPTVTNMGTSSAAVFDFGLQAGATGAAGPAGQDGAPGPTGPAATLVVGTVSSTGQNPPTVTFRGTPSAAIIDFGLQQGAPGSGGGGDGEGAPGPQGPPGPQGDPATIRIGEVHPTGNSGQDPPWVDNSGTDQDVVLDFALQRGLPGARGEDGEAATVTVASVSSVAPVNTTTFGQARIDQAAGSTPTHQRWDIHIPAGLRGASGEGGGGLGEGPTRINYRIATLPASRSSTGGALSTGTGVAMTARGGAVMLTANVGLSNNTANGGAAATIYRTTTGIPAAGAAPTGTALAGNYAYMPLTTMAPWVNISCIDGAVVSGTDYHYYLTITAVGGGTATMATASDIRAIEVGYLGLESE